MWIFTDSHWNCIVFAFKKSMFWHYEICEKSNTHSSAALQPSAMTQASTEHSSFISRKRRGRAAGLKILLSYTTWAKHSTKTSASNQSQGRNRYFSDNRSRKHPKEIFLSLIAAVNCEVSQNIKYNGRVLVVPLEPCAHLTAHILCWVTPSSFSGSLGPLKHEHDHWHLLEIDWWCLLLILGEFAMKSFRLFLRTATFLAAFL